MSIAQRVFHGSFGRVALLDMDRTLVTHSHHECHVLVKAAGADTFFNVNGRRVPLTDRHAVLVNAWQPHFYDHQAGAGPTQILALYIEPAWLAEIQHSLALSAHPGFFSQAGIELNSKNRRLADYLIAEAYSPDLVPRERIESLLFDFLIELIEDHSEWRQLRRLGPAPGSVSRTPASAAPATTCATTWTTRTAWPTPPAPPTCHGPTSSPCSAATPACHRC